MLNVAMKDRHRYCDGLSRRSFLTAGALSAAGLMLPDWLCLRARAAQSSQPTRDTSVILIWLDGGPTHMETYDVKADAPTEYRGTMKTPRNNAPGVDISDLFAEQAKCMDKLAIVRSLHHTTGDHFAAAHWMLTGYLGANAARLDATDPSGGSIAAKVCGARKSGVPPYVAVPHASSVGLNPGYNGAAYLGSEFNPFQSGGDPHSPDYTLQNLRPPNGLTLRDLQDRRQLLGGFDTLRRDLDRSGALENLDKFQRQAYEMISGPAAPQAFDIHKEEPRLRDRYRRHPAGQSCLLAPRVVP